MAWIKIPNASRADGLLRELFERYQNPDGGMDEILAIHGLHPEGMVGHMGLYREVMFARGPLTRRERELAATVVSAVNECHY